MESRIFRGFFFVTVLCTLFCISLDSSWAAEKYPSRPIEIICPASPGGAADGNTRACAKALSKILGVSVVPVNKPGGGGTVAYTAAVMSRPDGYTIGYAGDSIFTGVSLGLVTYKAEDVRVVGKFADMNHVLAVAADSPWKTFDEFMDYAKKNPGAVRYGCPPGAFAANICMEYFKKVSKLSLTQVPFQGDAETVPALLGKHVSLGVMSLTGAKPLADAGKLRILFSFYPRAEFGLDPSIADWPTVFKGVPHYPVVLYLVAPGKTPDDIVKVLEQAMEKFTKDPEFIADIKKYHNAVSFMDGKTYTEKQLPQRSAFMTEILKGTGLIK
jgi:tripartite-type tricarboxylate transporter receptor subunit TctC